jgi:hypothetical protein
MTSVRVHFDGKVFVPEQPVDLPVGFVAEISLVVEPVEPREKTALERLVEHLSQFPENPDWPADGAAQHDHYLYGTPKKP